MLENKNTNLKIEGISELSFSPMQLIDLNLVLELESASHIHPWSEKNFSDSLLAGHWAYCIRPMAGKLVKDFHTNLPILWGYCILFPAVDELHLLNITVSPKFRRLGIASRIMQVIEGVAFRQKFPKIILEVRPSNVSAVKLYESAGYDVIGVRKNYYPLNPGSNLREDAHVMAKTIMLDE